MRRRLAALRSHSTALSYPALLGYFVLLATVLLAAPMARAEGLRVAAVDPAAWDALLKNYVNPESRVDYRRLAAEGLPQLDAYLADLARPGNLAPGDAASKALLINAYNALTVRWVLRNYPVPSIWSTPDPFKNARHTLGGQSVSLDQIESMLRELGDPRIHAALVCAARSCPPLRREAYTAEGIDEQLDDNTRRWLANPELNRFYPQTAAAQLSPIFNWYGADFTIYPGGLDGFLQRYEPAQYRQNLGDRAWKITYLDYDWGLNDQSDLGENYSWFRISVDWLKNLFR